MDWRNCLLNATNLHRWQFGSDHQIGAPPSCLGDAKRCLGGVFAAKAEPLLRTIIGLILLSGNMLEPGNVVDAGAHTGAETCWYATLGAPRIVRAIEPIEANFKWLERAVPQWQAWGAHSIQVMHGGLSSQDVRVSMQRSRLNAMATLRNSSKINLGSSDSESLNLYRIDSLFQAEWRGERLALAHIYVEGLEADVLIGAERTLSRDLPLVTVEAHTNSTRGTYIEADRHAASKLSVVVQRVRYVAYVVEEQCGARGCRNFLCLPLQRESTLIATDVFQWLLSLGKIKRCEVDLWACLQASVLRARRWRTESSTHLPLSLSPSI